MGAEAPGNATGGKLNVGERWRHRDGGLYTVQGLVKGKVLTLRGVRLFIMSLGKEGPLTWCEGVLYGNGETSYWRTVKDFLRSFCYELAPRKRKRGGSHGR
jgi:hypothetical protein